MNHHQPIETLLVTVAFVSLILIIAIAFVQLRVWGLFGVIAVITTALTTKPEDLLVMTLSVLVAFLACGVSLGKLMYERKLRLAQDRLELERACRKSIGQLHSSQTRGASR